MVLLLSSTSFSCILLGNWLSRLGALILVIGVALFLGYSLTQLGPMGKVAIGLAIGSRCCSPELLFVKMSAMALSRRA